MNSVSRPVFSSGERSMVAVQKYQKESALHSKTVNAGPLRYTELDELNFLTQLLMNASQAFFRPVLGMLHLAWLGSKVAR